MREFLEESGIYEDVSVDLYLKKSELIEKCLEDILCLSKELLPLEIYEVLLIKVREEDDVYTLSLNLIDILQQRVLRSQAARITKVGIDNKSFAKSLLNNLIYSGGTISLKCDLKSAEIFLDGKKVGEPPLGKITGILPGNHKIKIVIPNHPPYEKEVIIAPGTVEELDVRLEPLVVKAPLKNRKRKRPSYMENDCSGSYGVVS